MRGRDAALAGMDSGWIDYALCAGKYYKPACKVVVIRIIKQIFLLKSSFI